MTGGILTHLEASLECHGGDGEPSADVVAASRAHLERLQLAPDLAPADAAHIPRWLDGLRGITDHAPDEAPPSLRALEALGKCRLRTPAERGGG